MSGGEPVPSPAAQEAIDLLEGWRCLDETARISSMPDAPWGVFRALFDHAPMVRSIRWKERNGILRIKVVFPEGELSERARVLAALRVELRKHRPAGFGLVVE